MSAMDVTTALESRRAVKVFDPEHHMSEQDVDEILRLTVCAPSAFNLQHWRFVRVKEPALRAEIRKIAWDQSQVTDASLLLVLCVDLRAWEREPARHWVTAPEAVQNIILPAIDSFYRDNEQMQRDEGMRSCGLVAMSLMLAARALHYDSCPMDGFDFHALARLIRLPDDFAICMMVAIGKPKGEPLPATTRLPVEEILVTDRF